MPQAPVYDPATLAERLQQDGGGLSLEALSRIRQLEQLCAMMTDSGVILEEDVVELAKADWWWMPGEAEFGADDVAKAMEDAVEEGIYSPLEVTEWCRSHQLGNSYVVQFPSILDFSGREIVGKRTEEFISQDEAERAVADHQLRARRNGDQGK